MNILFGVLVVLCGVVAVVLTVIFLIRLIAKKPKKRIGLSALFCVVGVVVFSIIGSQIWFNNLTSQERETFYAEQQLKEEQHEAERLAKEQAKFTESAAIKAEKQVEAAAPSEDPTVTETPAPTAAPALTEAERFAADNDVSVAFAESLEGVLIEMKLTDKSRVGFFHYDLSDVYNFERINDWAEGERYKMWMNMEHIWYAYSKGDTIVGIRDGNGNIFYQTEYPKDTERPSAF